MISLYMDNEQEIMKKLEDDILKNDYEDFVL